MVKPTYLLFAVLTFVIFLAILVAFVAAPDSGPFDSGTTPSQIHSK
jgi:F0F1-type ATP synthase membrane subunit b/b'